MWRAAPAASEPAQKKNAGTPQMCQNGDTSENMTQHPPPVAQQRRGASLIYIKQHTTQKTTNAIPPFHFPLHFLCLGTSYSKTTFPRLSPDTTTRHTDTCCAAVLSSATTRRAGGHSGSTELERGEGKRDSRENRRGGLLRLQIEPAVESAYDRKQTARKGDPARSEAVSAAL